MIFKTQVLVQHDLFHAAHTVRDVFIPGEQQIGTDTLIVQYHRHAAHGQVDKPHVWFVIKQTVSAGSIEKPVAKPV